MSRIAIITGGSSGIGRALGAALVARGDDVVLAARTEADLQRTADELSAQGPGKAREPPWTCGTPTKSLTS